jgi:hypothetical protein
MLLVEVGASDLTVSPKPGEYEEIYFDEYYRVLVLGEKGNYIVSVDVYARREEFEYSEKTCVNSVCLLVKEVREATSSVQGVLRVLVIAVKVLENPVEIVNVKWILDHKPDRDEVEKIYKESWKLVSVL